MHLPSAEHVGWSHPFKGCKFGLHICGRIELLISNVQMVERILELHRPKWRRCSTRDVPQFRGVCDERFLFESVDESKLIFENGLA